MGAFQELGDGIFRRHYESLSLNIGVVIGDDAILVVDSRASHDQADVLRTELASLTTKPVGWVINTHYHWDHTWGNARFPEAELWGHELCRSEMLANGERARQQVLEWMPAEHHDAVRAVAITPPTHVFSESASLHIGRSIAMSYHGLAHTNSDVVVRADEVLFAGDLVEEGAPPAFGDAFPLDWPATLSSIELPPTVVPGHGDIVDPAFVDRQRNEIAAVADLAVAGHASGIPIDELAADGPFPRQVMHQALGRAFSQLGGSS